MNHQTIHIPPDRVFAAPRCFPAKADIVIFTLSARETEIPVALMEVKPYCLRAKHVRLLDAPGASMTGFGKEQTFPVCEDGPDPYADLTRNVLDAFEWLAKGDRRAHPFRPSASVAEWDVGRLVQRLQRHYYEQYAHADYVDCADLGEPTEADDLRTATETLARPRLQLVS